MLTKSKALVAALVVAGSSLAFVVPASAAVPSQGSSQFEQNWFDRATNGGHHPGDTNGGT
jgi:hypothetical protein